MTKRGLELLERIEVARRLALLNRKGDLDPGLIDDLLYRDPTFPRPVKFGRFNKWRADQLDEYIASLPAREARPRSKKKQAVKQ